MRFDLSGPQSYFPRMITRFFLAMGLAGAGIIAVLWAAGLLDAVTAIITGLWMPAFAILMSWRVRYQSRGEVELEPDRLVLRHRQGGSSTYPWVDIGGLRLASAADLIDPWTRLMARMSGVALDEPVVEVRLRRRVRFNPVTERPSGTGGFGIPIGVKRLVLSLKEPEVFLEAARLRLGSFEAN